MAPHSSSSNPSSRSSSLSTFQNLVKPFIGAGILALPASFKQGGLIASVILVITMSLMANYCIRCLLECLQTIIQPGYRKHHTTSNNTTESHMLTQPITATSALLSPLVDNSDRDSRTQTDIDPPIYTDKIPPSYREIGAVAYGSWGKYAVDLNLILSQLGFCTAYMAFIGENMNAVVSDISENHWILLNMTLLIFFCQIRGVSTIAFTSAIGNGVYLVSIIIIFVDGFTNQCCLDGYDNKNDVHLSWFDISGLPFVFGTACFALEGIGLILPVKAAMQHHQQHRFSLLLNIAIALVASAYVVFGSLGYLFYGENTQSPITKNLSSGWVSDTVKVSLCASLFFSYILQMFPVVDITDYAIVLHLSKRAVSTVQSSIAADRGDDELQDKSSTGSSAGDDDDSSMVVEPLTFTSSNSFASNSFQSNIPNNPVLQADPIAAPILIAAAPLTPPTVPVLPPMSFSLLLLQCFVRAGCVGFTAGIAIAIGADFPFVISLTGSLANSMIAFILPALFYLKLVVYPAYPTPIATGWVGVRGYILPLLVVILGAAASFIGVYSAIKDKVESS